jgi:hypothetical protein
MYSAPEVRSQQSLADQGAKVILSSRGFILQNRLNENTLRTMGIEHLKSGSIECPCSCNSVFPMFSGLLKYGTSNEVAFRIAHFSHEDSGPHLWLLLGSGPWFQDDTRGCWVTLHSWVASDSVIAKVEEPECSPFTAQHAFEERRLSREEVLSQNGGLQWAIERREELLRLHPESSRFLLGINDARPLVHADRL